MKKMAYIYNPLAGRGTMQNYLSDIIDVFTKSDYEVTVLPTQYKHHCRDYIASEGARFDLIAVSGGDGTVNEAFNGLCAIEESKRPALGYIPTGTTNDFAASCGIPHDPYEAAKVIASGREVNIDAGLFNGKSFAYVAAFGAFTYVAYDTSQQVKNIMGYGAYVLEGIKQMNKNKAYHMKITTQEGVIEDDFIFGMVANSHSVGGLKLKSVNVDVSDGMFEVLLVKKITKPTDLGKIIADMRSKNVNSEQFYMLQTDRITFSSDEEIAWTLDGEFGGSYLAGDVENLRCAIRMVVAEEEDIQKRGIETNGEETV